MKEIIEIMFSGFWPFVGCLIVFAALLKAPIILINVIMRHWNIHKHGYPPSHCDADGDFKKEEE